MSAPLLEAVSIRKSFAGIRALRGVSFDLYPGEVHALVGENGAGKSTLVKIVTGAERPDAGTLAVRGQVIERMDPATSRALGIAAIYQQPMLFLDLSVAENIALAVEPPRAWRRLDWAARRAHASEILGRIGAAIDPDRIARTLTLPEQQIVEIAKALGADATLLVMDEPTASLSDREVERLLATVQRLRDHGAGIIYISHRLEEVFRIADRITVLRDGETVATRSAGVTRDELIALMVGRELSSVFPPHRTAPGEIALELRHLTSRQAGIRDVSLAVRHGEILGIAGLVGAGRTELAEAIVGLRPIDRGEVRAGGRPARLHAPADAIRLGIAYVPEDRARHGVVGELPIAFNVTLPRLDAVSRHGVIDRRAEVALAERYVDRLLIKTPSALAPVSGLSGGNQQKVALARWLSIEPRVLILDEPTQGIDVGAKAEIHGIIAALAEQGVAVVMISSDMPEILGMSDRVAVMRRGTIAGVLDHADATASRILALALGEEAPVSKP